MAKFLLVTHIYPPFIDGGSKIIFKVGEYFSSHQHELLVLTSNCQSSDDFINKTSEIYQFSDKNIIRLPVETHLHKLFKLFNISLSKGPIFNPIKLIMALIRTKHYRPDFILTGPFPTLIPFYARIIRKITEAKIIICPAFHTNDPDYYQTILINILKRANYIWALTEYETNFFINNFKINPDKIITAGCGVDISFTLKKESKKLTYDLLYVGSFSSHKGIETILNAFFILKTSTPQLTLTLAGQPSLYSTHIESIIKSMPPNIRHGIKIVKRFSQKRLPSLLDSCFVLISASTQESFGLVLLESMARGKPVVVSNIPASTEIISKSRSGLIFETNNSNDLIKKIQKLYHNKDLYRQLSQNGLSFAKNHTWNAIGQKLCQKILF